MDSSSSRLGTVQWLRDRQEREARKAYNQAHAEERRAREHEQRLREALVKETRLHGQAALWALFDVSRAAQEKKVAAAAEVTARAATVATQTQQAHLSALQRLKAVEKVVEGLLTEARAEAARKERRDADELAVLRFGR